MIYARDAPNFGYNFWRKMGHLRVRREALNWGEISLPKLGAVGPNIPTDIGASDTLSDSIQCLSFAEK